MCLNISNIDSFSLQKRLKLLKLLIKPLQKKYKNIVKENSGDSVDEYSDEKILMQKIRYINSF